MAGSWFNVAALDEATLLKLNSLPVEVSPRTSEASASTVFLLTTGLLRVTVQHFASAVLSPGIVLPIARTGSQRRGPRGVSLSVMWLGTQRPPRMLQLRPWLLPLMPLLPNPPARPPASDSHDDRDGAR
jgi:hypothetical protein